MCDCQLLSTTFLNLYKCKFFRLIIIPLCRQNLEARFNSFNDSDKHRTATKPDLMSNSCWKFVINLKPRWSAQVLWSMTGGQQTRSPKEKPCSSKSLHCETSPRWQVQLSCFTLLFLFHNTMQTNYVNQPEEIWSQRFQKKVYFIMRTLGYLFSCPKAGR